LYKKLLSGTFAELPIVLAVYKRQKYDQNTKSMIRTKKGAD